MFIFTGKQILNCDNTIRIYYVSDNGKYKVLAHPGGDIITVDTDKQAWYCLSIIFDALMKNIEHITSGYIKRQLKDYEDEDKERNNGNKEMGWHHRC